jgi:hypothetical protein
MEDAVIEEESMKEIDIRKALQYPFIIFLRLFIQPTIILEYIFSHILRQTMGC